MISVATVIVVIAGGVGLVAGSLINIVADRVPAGIPLRQPRRCSSCSSALRARERIPVVGWFVRRGRCATCHARVPAREPIVEVLTSCAFVVITAYFFGVFGVVPFAAPEVALVIVTIAYLYFATVSIVLTLTDVNTRRLPNVIVLPGYLVALILLAAASLLGADAVPMLRALGGCAALFAFYFVLAIVRPGGMGGGDVKLAGIIGLYLGFLGWAELAVGAFLAFAYGGIFGLILLVTGRAGRRSRIPFGPWMIAGAWTGIFVGDKIVRAYLGLSVA